MNSLIRVIIIVLIIYKGDTDEKKCNDSTDKCAT